MPRHARVVIPDRPHHITHRGYEGRSIFLCDDDYVAYLRLLRDCLAAHCVELLAYCLMTNHIHLIAVPLTRTGLGTMMQQLQTAHMGRMRRRECFTGEFWHDRFYSTPMDDYHMWAGIRYVERNPVRGGLVTIASQYPWSSAAAHCGLGHDPLLVDSPLVANRPEDWAAWLRDENDEDSDRIRRCSLRGALCARRTASRG